MSLTIKNYKKLEGWAHNYKDFRIGEVRETENEYTFRVAYNSMPYTIKIFRKELTALIFETLIIKCKPKAQQTTGNTNFNNPF
jgi:hypothetical protein